MFLCFIMLVRVVRSRLVLILLKLVPLFTRYDVIYVKIVEISTAHNFAMVSSDLLMFVAVGMPHCSLHLCQTSKEMIKSSQSYERLKIFQHGRQEMLVTIPLAVF